MLEDLDKILDQIMSQSQALAEGPDVTLLPRFQQQSTVPTQSSSEADSDEADTLNDAPGISINQGTEANNIEPEELNVPTIEPFPEANNSREEIPEADLPAPEFFGIPETTELGVSQPDFDLSGTRSGFELVESGGAPDVDRVSSGGVDLPGPTPAGNDAPELAIPAAPEGESQETTEIPEPGDRAEVSPELAIPSPEGIAADRAELPELASSDSGIGVDLPAFSEPLESERIELPRFSSVKPVAEMEIPSVQNPVIDFGEWSKAATSEISDRLESRISSGLSDLYARMSHFVEDRIGEELLKLDRRFTR